MRRRCTQKQPQNIITIQIQHEKIFMETDSIVFEKYNEERQQKYNINK